MASFENVLVRYGWATHHFDVLRTEIIKYVHGNPCKFRVDRYDSAHSQAWGSFVADPPVPVYIPLGFGDVLQSAHACLDYLICELVRTREKDSFTSNQFPIADSRESFDEEIGRKRLRGVPFGAVAIIEQLQPYNAGKNSNESPLVALKTLTNIHKHRNILVTALGARRAPADIDVFEVDGVVYAKGTSLMEEPFDLNAEFGPFAVDGTQVKMEGNYASVIVLGETAYKGREVLSLLGWICMALRDFIFPAFQQFF